MKVASIGLGWWSDVLADAVKRSGKLQILSCFSRSQEKRAAFSKKYGCKVLARYELHETMIDALTREKQIKSGSRAKKLALIKALNPEWTDLYESLI